jgi:hypothetical protein
MEVGVVDHFQSMMSFFLAYGFKVICMCSISYTNSKEALTFLQTSNQKLKRGATEIAAKNLCLIW